MPLPESDEETVVVRAIRHREDRDARGLFIPCCKEAFEPEVGIASLESTRAQPRRRRGGMAAGRPPAPARRPPIQGGAGTADAMRALTGKPIDRNRVDSSAAGNRG